MATSLKIEEALKGRVQHLASQRRRSPHWMTGQEVRTWLNTWGTEDEKAMPECHT
ncbi:MAG: hypothetical protein FD131_4186 [Rhodocyclaceae bacterium]|nr:MAG: hypothetical protein FD131_4186 [Rhodocyclaceae bacterium]